MATLSTLWNQFLAPCLGSTNSCRKVEVVESEFFSLKTIYCVWRIAVKYQARQINPIPQLCSSLNSTNYLGELRETAGLGDGCLWVHHYDRSCLHIHPSLVIEYSSFKVTLINTCIHCKQWIL